MIRTSVITLAAFLALVGAGTLRADLARAKAERNLGKRSRLAMDNANAQFRAASQTYKTGGNWETAAAALNEVRESVDLAYAAVKETGKQPRQSGDYKNLEIKTRALLKNLKDFLQSWGWTSVTRWRPSSLMSSGCTTRSSRASWTPGKGSDEKLASAIVPLGRRAVRGPD